MGDRGQSVSNRWASGSGRGDAALGMGAEALWQERVDRAEEQVVLRALYTQFVGNEASLRAQSDSIDSAIALVASAASMGPSALVTALETDDELAMSMAIRRPWTVEFRVGALDGTLGTQRSVVDP